MIVLAEWYSCRDTEHSDPERIDIKRFHGRPAVVVTGQATQAEGDLEHIKFQILKGIRTTMKKILSLALAAVLALSMLGGSALAATNYVTDNHAAAGTTTTFQKYLIVPDGVEVPSASFSFTIAAGEAQEYNLGTNPTTMSIYAGVQADDISITDVEFSSADTASLKATAADTEIDVARLASARISGGTADAGVELEAAKGEKFVAHTATIDFSDVVFPEPGIYRYIVSESANADMAAKGIVNDTDVDRVLDVYVTDDNGVLSVASYVLHTNVDSVPLGADMGSGTVATAGAAVADKTDGFTNEYKPTDLTFSKVVAGNQASHDKVFDFTLEIGNMNEGDKLVVSIADDSDDNTVDGNADATSASNSATIAANAGKTNVTSLTVGSDGTVTQHFYLQHGQSIAVRGLPLNATYSVTENAEDYKSEVTSSDAASGNMAADRSVEYTNTRDGVVPTGIMLSIVPGIVIVGAAGAGIAMSRKKKDEDGEE